MAGQALDSAFRPSRQHQGCFCTLRLEAHRYRSSCPSITQRSFAKLPRRRLHVFPQCYVDSLHCCMAWLTTRSQDSARSSLTASAPHLCFGFSHRSRLLQGLSRYRLFQVLLLQVLFLSTLSLALAAGQLFDPAETRDVARRTHRVALSSPHSSAITLDRHPCHWVGGWGGFGAVKLAPHIIMIIM